MSTVDHPVGEGLIAKNAGWTFGGPTAAVFGDHVRRSIPMYDVGHEIVCGLSDFFVHDDSTVYELGVSVGDLLSRLVERHQHVGTARWIGVDVEEEMTARAQSKLSTFERATIETADLATYELEKSDFIVSYYCLQFIRPRIRQLVMNRIYESLEWGGAFVWFEKVRGPDARFQDILSLLYTDFKLQNDYSPEEIIGKSRSLKGVLEPFSSSGNRGLLERAGFVDVTTVFRYLCFEGVLAIK